MDQNTENVLLSAWSHPLLTKLMNPNPPTASAAVQSDPLPDTMPPVQLDVELVKEEVVVVLTEDELEEVEEAVIGRATSPVDQEVSSMAGDECAVNVEVDRWDTRLLECQISPSSCTKSGLFSGQKTRWENWMSSQMT